MRISHLIAALFIFTVALSAQIWASVIDGKVIDQKGQPISEVNIRSHDFATTYRTDNDGKFTIDFRGQFPLTVNFTHVGYVPRSIKIEASNKNLEISMQRQIYSMQGLTVTAGRAVKGRDPVSYDEISRKEIEREADLVEIPELLELTPNLYSYSDAGGGLGYSYLKIRGFDARRTPVYINGIPLNDPEDHALYFVDLPDFGESVDNIQVQRGVGNALYGDAAFGGSINMVTAPISKKNGFNMEFGYGGFISDGAQVGLMRKKSVAYSSGLLDNGWSFSGRYVDQYSDGYRERSWYNGQAYYLTINRLDPRMITNMSIYGGPMHLHASWDGITKEMLAEDRRYNPYMYANEGDNFNQPHFELHNIYTLDDNRSIYSTLFFIRGTGYYEQYEPGDWGTRLYDYNLSDDSTIYTDLIRRKQVAKNQYGLASQLEWRGDHHQSNLGLSYYFFDSEHWGEVIWADALEPSYISAEHPFRYFEYFGKIHNFSATARRMQELNDRLNITADLQLRYLYWNVHQTPFGIYEGRIYDMSWLHLSPRLGANYKFDERWSFYTGFSIASHVPNDDMISDADNPADIPRLKFDHKEGNINYYGDVLVDPERVYDFELGTQFKNSHFLAGLNLFWMEYRNEIVPDGGKTDDGYPTYGNAKRSVHRGIETSWTWKIISRLEFSGHYSINENLIKEYDQIIDPTTTIEHRNATVPAFPKYMGNFNLEYDFGPGYLLYRLRAVGRQNLTYFGRYYNIDGQPVDVSLQPYTVSTLKAAYTLTNILGSIITLEGRVENLFNKKYETFGYQWGDEFYYWPAAERSWYINIKMAVE